MGNNSDDTDIPPLAPYRQKVVRTETTCRPQTPRSLISYLNNAKDAGTLSAYSPDDSLVAEPASAEEKVGRYDYQKQPDGSLTLTGQKLFLSHVAQELSDAGIRHALVGETITIAVPADVARIEALKAQHLTKTSTAREAHSAQEEVLTMAETLRRESITGGSIRNGKTL